MCDVSCKDLLVEMEVELVPSYYYENGHDGSTGGCLVQPRVFVVRGDGFVAAKALLYWMP